MSAVAAAPATWSRDEHRRVLRLMGGLTIGMFGPSLSQTILSTALPTIVGQLGGQDQLAWLASGQLLATTVSMPLWGKLSDIYGRKRLFQLSLLIFLAGSVFAALSSGIGMLVMARAVQGIGSGGNAALTQALLADVIPPRHRGRYSGYLGAAFALATVCGPLLGGFLVVQGAQGWRLCFLVGLPLIFVAMAVVHSTVDADRPRARKPFDALGATLISSCILSAGFLLSLGGSTVPWTSPLIFALGAAVVGLLVAAAWQERRAVDPLLPPHLFRMRTFRLAGATLLLAGVAMYGALTYLPLYLQIVKGFEPAKAGLLTLPMVVTMVLSSTIVGRWMSNRGRYKRYPLSGMALSALGMVMLSRLDAASTFPVAAAAMALVGTGIGMIGQVLIVACQNEARNEDIGVVSSTTSFMRSLGGALGVALLGAVLSGQLASTVPAQLQAHHIGADAAGPFDKLLGTPAAVAHLPGAVHSAVVDGMAQSLDAVFLAIVPLCLLGVVLVSLLRENPLRTSHEIVHVATDEVSGTEIYLEATA